jgi:LytS/YehU family sensor histidine kinase
MSTKTLFRISLPVISMLVFAFALHGQIPTLKEYHNLHENGIKTGGVRMITISTPSGNFKVWTKQVGNNVMLAIHDNGVGFDTAAVARDTGTSRGMGLQAMDERVKILNGTMEIHSKPGTGSSIVFSIAINSEE